MKLFCSAELWRITNLSRSSPAPSPLLSIVLVWLPSSPSHFLQHEGFSSFFMAPVPYRFPEKWICPLGFGHFFLLRTTFQAAFIATSSCVETVDERVGTVAYDGHIMKFCSQGNLKKALSLLSQDGADVGHSALLCIIRSCSIMRASREGRFLHYHLITYCLDEDVFLTNMIIRMYDKCGSLPDARSLFDTTKRRNIVSWNTILGAYSSRGCRKEVFYLMCQMLDEKRIQPDKVTFITILGICDETSNVADIKLLHGSIVDIGLERDVSVANVLINMYSRTGALEDATVIFNRMQVRNVITWNTLIAGHATPGYANISLRLFYMMHMEGIAGDKATFMSSLNACTNPKVLDEGRLIHFEISYSGLESDCMIGTALIKMYGRCQSLSDACSVFENLMPNTDVILWTTMIAAYIQQGYNKEALQFYCRMRCQGIKPNKITLVTVLNACASLGSYMEGKVIHECLTEKEIMSDIILTNALITMYQKCGHFLDAEKLFLRMPKKDVISCTAMIVSFAEQGRGFEALLLFQEMLQVGVTPDKFTFSSVLDACASLAALTDGRLLYSLVLESRVDWDCVLGNALISMYGECGILQDAYAIFVKLNNPDSISWSSIVCAYANHGFCDYVLNLFQEMHQQGFKPSKVTYISVLSACSHAGDIDTGYRYFLSMLDEQYIVPASEHYMCMIDLVGRAGCVEEAEFIVAGMPVQPDAILWNTLLGACRVHSIVDKGQFAADHVLEIDVQNEVAYVVLANLYASTGKWEKALAAKKAMILATKDC